MSAEVCPRCGEPLPARANFCPNCGAPVLLSQASERRIVTVAFVDLAGSTELQAPRLPDDLKSDDEAGVSGVQKVAGVVRQRLG